MLLPAAGVNVIRPATSRKARPGRRAGPPATGTFSGDVHVAVPPAGTLTDDVLEPERVRRTGRVGLRNVNEAAEAPLFFSVISRVFE